MCIRDRYQVAESSTGDYRAKTIKDAVESVIIQKTNFWFNLIVVDNHSTDGTTEILEKYAKQGMLIHLIPERKDLGIGGCWNEGIFHENCGRFAVQLDSDAVSYTHLDVYKRQG